MHKRVPQHSQPAGMRMPKAFEAEVKKDEVASLADRPPFKWLNRALTGSNRANGAVWDVDF